MDLTYTSKHYVDIENLGTDTLLSIIIPVYNNVNFTKSALLDLIKLPSNHEIIIVDNGSTDETAVVVNEIIAGLTVNSPKVVYIGCPKNLGFGRANNKGYKHANGQNILFLNNDIRVKSDHSTWTDALIQECKAGKLVSANGGLLDGRFNFIRETDKLVVSEYFYLSGWCLAGSRETFDKLILDLFSDDRTDEIKEGKAWGPWNEKFFAYFEDDDLTWRAIAMDVPLSVVGVPVHHFGSMTAKKIGLSNMYKTSQQIFKDIWAGKLKK
jgi:GT2 family glycosyltransferase